MIDIPSEIAIPLKNATEEYLTCHWVPIINNSVDQNFHILTNI